MERPDDLTRRRRPPADGPDADLQGEITKKAGTTAAPLSSSSIRNSNIFLQMENILERLKILNYHEYGANDKSKSLLSIGPSHFALPPADSMSNKLLFDDFCKVCNFLFARIFKGLKESGALEDARSSAVEIDLFDTPNNRINIIMTELRNTGFEAQFSAYRLTKQAGGAEACAVLDHLTGHALQSQGFRFVNPNFQREDDIMEAEVDDAADIAMHGDDGGTVEDDDGGLADDPPVEGDGDDLGYGLGADSDDEGVSGSGRGGGSRGRQAVGSPLFTPGGRGGRPSSGRAGPGSVGGTPLTGQGDRNGGTGIGVDKGLDDGADEEDENVSILRSRVDPVRWAQELSRVSAQLKTMKGGVKGSAGTSRGGGGSKSQWRVHLEQTKQHDHKISNLLPGTKRKLGGMSTYLSDAIERVRSKEAVMNRQVGPLQEDYNAKIQHMKSLRGQCEESHGTLSSRQNELSEVSDRLVEVKEEMSTRGNTMTDTGPLMRIKSALKQVKSEIKQMELRMGVATHALMQAKLRSQTSGGEEGAGRPSGNVGGDDSQSSSPDDDGDDDDDSSDDLGYGGRRGSGRGRGGGARSRGGRSNDRQRQQQRWQVDNDEDLDDLDDLIDDDDGADDDLDYGHRRPY